MHFKRLLGTALAIGLAALIATGCGGGIPENSICTVDGDPIAKKDYQRIIDQARKNWSLSRATNRSTASRSFAPTAARCTRCS